MKRNILVGDLLVLRNLQDLTDFVIMSAKHSHTFSALNADENPDIAVVWHDIQGVLNEATLPYDLLEPWAGQPDT